MSFTRPASFAAAFSAERMGASVWKQAARGLITVSPIRTSLPSAAALVSTFCTWAWPFSSRACSLGVSWPEAAPWAMRPAWRAYWRSDVAALAAAFARLAESTELVQTMGQSARAFAETFTWERTAQQTEAHLVASTRTGG